KGVAAYVGDGRNRWPAVHRLDAAHLYRLVLENGAAGGGYHAGAGGGGAVRDISGGVGPGLDGAGVRKGREGASHHFGWFAHFATLDNPTSSAFTRERLGWRPAQPALIPDLDRARYFEGRTMQTGRNVQAAGSALH